MQYPTLIFSLLALGLTTATPLTPRQAQTSTDPSSPDLYAITLSLTGPHIAPSSTLVIPLNELYPCDDGSSTDYPSCELTALSVIPGTFHGLLANDPTVQHVGDAPVEKQVQCIGYKDVSGVIAGTGRFWVGKDTELRSAGTGVASLLCYVVPGSE